MPSLVTLPTELIVEIADCLRERPADLKSLSSTNRRLRHAASHILFRTLNIACPLVSDMLLEHMLTKYRHAIRRIHLHIRLRPNLPVDDINEDGILDDYFADIPSIWGTDRSDTLQQLVRGEIFSHINSFSVRFDPSQFGLEGCWFGDGGCWGGGESILVFHDWEDDEEFYSGSASEIDDPGTDGNGLMLKFERMYIWRAQYNGVFEDLVVNPNITKLRFVDLLPKRASIWYSDEWVSMLQRLTHFDVTIFGAKSRGWHGNTTPGFIDFINEFPIFISRYLTNVKHLRLEASPLSVFGTDTYIGWHEPFPLYAPASALHSLELKNIVLGNDVMDYLSQQGGTLRELTLHNCMCYTCELGPEAQWSDIWGTVSEDCKVLRRITFLQDKKPPLNSDEYTRWSRIAKRMVKRNKDRIVWRYVGIDPERGTVLEDPDANVQEVVTGHAYEKYCDLQKTLMERGETPADE